MKKHLGILLVAAAVLTAVFVAGCTSQTASPTPSSNAAESTASTAKMASYVQSLGYNVIAPFNKSDIATMGGRDMYATMATQGNQTGITVGAVICKSPTDTSDIYNMQISGFKKTGTVLETNSTTTTLMNTVGNYREVVSQDTADNMVFTIF